MKKMYAILTFSVFVLSACNSDKPEETGNTKGTDTTEKEKPAESGGPCEYVDMPGKVNTLEYYQISGIVKGRFSASSSEHSEMLKNSYTVDTIFYYAQEGDRTQKGSGIRATMTVMVSGSCQPYPGIIKAADGSIRLLVDTDSLNNTITDLKEEYK